MSEFFLLILTGPPGSGKTTVGRSLAERFEHSAVIDADFFWASVVNGLIPPWELEANEQNQILVRAALSSARRFVEAGYSTVLEGHVGPWYVDLVREELGDLGVPISYLVLRPSLEHCLLRALERTNEPRHVGALTLEDPIRHMYGAYGTSGVHERHVLDNSGLNVDETVQSIVERMATGTLLWAL